MKSGVGTLYIVNGDSFVGQFREDKVNGYGKY